MEPETDRDPTQTVDLSVVIPCLNEADTLAVCLAKAREGIEASGVNGEIVVADNGSNDGSVDIAQAAGARVVPVPARGYGAALMGGIEAARGRWVLMGDADDSYDFREIPKFVASLREGNDLVQGCRLPSGGGTLAPGAMPALHRWWGNPMFSALTRIWFGAPVHDAYCGLRAFTKAHYARLDQRCTGMEFAIEMIVKSSLYGARMGEVPITLHPDGRRSHPPHLRTFRDGWRTLRFLLLYSPRWLFLVPGGGLVAAGLVGYALALPGVTIGRATLDAHTLLFSSLAILSGHLSLLFGLLAKAFAVTEGLVPPSPRLERLFRTVSLERGLSLGLASMGFGLLLLLAAVNQWRLADFGQLDYSHTMRWVIPGATLTALGLQTVLGSFLVSVLRLARR